MNPYLKHGLGVTVIASFLIGAAACETTKTPEQESKDRTTENEVRSALQADTHIYTSHIKIHVDGGVVHLSGYVWNDFDMYTAQQDALSVDGVKRVVNDMELEEEGIGNSPYSD